MTRCGGSVLNVRVEDKHTPGFSCRDGRALDRLLAVTLRP
jgi:hypothetical protein